MSSKKCYLVFLASLLKKCHSENIFIRLGLCGFFSASLTLMGLLGSIGSDTDDTSACSSNRVNRVVRRRLIVIGIGLHNVCNWLTIKNALIG